MSDYKQILINKFGGLNSTVDPSLINDGEARDICNLRQEKLGKLVTRNGYTFALFYNPNLQKLNPSIGGVIVGNPQDRTEVPKSSPANYTDKGNDINKDYFLEFNSLQSDEISVRSFLNNRGIIGIGEFCLDTYWTELDTDRLMIYFVRTIDQDKEKVPNDLGCYLFSPVTGKFKDLLIFPDSLIKSSNTLLPNIDRVGPSMWYDSHPEGSSMDTHLKAPLFFDDSGNWIDKYIDINEYRYSMIISDRTNGDLMIRDAQTLNNNYQEKGDEQHSLHISSLSKETFDINIIRLDNRFEVGNENDIVNGVETSMALYQFEPQKSKTIPYQISTMPLQYDTTSGITSIPTTNNVYSTENSRYEFSDLLLPLQLKQEEFTDADGKVISQSSANVYLWNDTKLLYYPCTGKEYNRLFSPTTFDPSDDRNYYLTSKDRSFKKTNYLLPKIEELNEHSNIGENAPLGVWKYRFVWDFGDGVYSAPSAEMLAPDIMWSAIPNLDSTFHDSWSGDSYIFDPLTYKRHVSIDGSNAVNTSNFLSPTGSGSTLFYNRIDGTLPSSAINVMSPTAVQNASTKLSNNFVNLIIKIKDALYDNTHIYNSRPSLSIDDTRRLTLYRLIQTGDIPLKGDTFQGKSGTDTLRCGITLRGISKFNINQDHAGESLTLCSLLLNNTDMKLTSTDETSAFYSNITNNNLIVEIIPNATTCTHKLWIHSDKEPDSSFYYTKEDVPSEVKSRLIYTGYVQIGNNVTVPGKTTGIWNGSTLSGVYINVLIESEKLSIIEQLTSYFPSSLLFNAPRLGIAIEKAKIPNRAKGVMIFRTKASHTNDYQHQEYGLVKQLSFDGMLDKKIDKYTNYYFFDDVKDSALDFNYNPNDYEGVTDHLHSRFNQDLNERIYYANLWRRFPQLEPKGYGDVYPIKPESDDTSFIKVHIIAYNKHDLEAKEAARMKSAITSVSSDPDWLNVSHYGSNILTSAVPTDLGYRNRNLCSNINISEVSGTGTTTIGYNVLKPNIPYLWMTDGIERKIGFPEAIDYVSDTTEYFKFPDIFDKDFIYAKRKNIHVTINKIDGTIQELTLSGTTGEIKMRLTGDSIAGTFDLEFTIGSASPVTATYSQSETKSIGIGVEYEDTDKDKVESIHSALVSDSIFTTNSPTEANMTGSSGKITSPMFSPTTRIGNISTGTLPMYGMADSGFENLYLTSTEDTWFLLFNNIYAHKENYNPFYDKEYSNKYNPYLDPDLTVIGWQVKVEEKIGSHKVQKLVNGLNNFVSLSRKGKISKRQYEIKNLHRVVTNTTPLILKKENYFKIHMTAQIEDSTAKNTEYLLTMDSSGNLATKDGYNDDGIGFLRNIYLGRDTGMNIELNKLEDGEFYSQINKSENSHVDHPYGVIHYLNGFISVGDKTTTEFRDVLGHRAGNSYESNRVIDRTNPIFHQQPNNSLSFGEGFTYTITRTI